ncbi:SDR family oxidoreductase [Sessilibacter corallicola]|uniref:SDR family oxidoreductase n=1 Tax=Sessilibacter corallicola TaxID=2904075 RepID=UPI001E549C2E|nr:SDR family oxidoreductase [Sessilibacter corallicola]MCE2030035.1 SDR family oxidoreductase [Sessilibacter corallicola]
MNIVITGANRGIGLALTKAYLSQGARVFALCRTTSEALSATTAEVIEGIDVSDDSALATLAEHLKQTLGSGESIQVLINNAGILTNESLGAMDFEAIAEQININSIAPLKVTAALLPLLSKGSKIGLVTSRMGSHTDNSSGGYYGYRMSKAALNSAGVSLAQDLKPHGIAVALLHPGFVQTDMVGGAGDIPPETAADGLIKRLEELSLSNTGGFWHSNGEQLPW